MVLQGGVVELIYEPCLRQSPLSRLRSIIGRIAQWLEQRAYTSQVPGSSPGPPTSESTKSDLVTRPSFATWQATETHDLKASCLSLDPRKRYYLDKGWKEVKKSGNRVIRAPGN